MIELANKSLEQRMPLEAHIYFNLAVFCFWFAIYIYSPLFSVYLETIHFSYSSIGIILGGYGVTQLVFRLPLGILTDKLYHLRKYLLVSAFVTALISCLLLIYFESFIAVLAARLLAGATASMWVMATVLYSYYFSPEKSSRAMGTMQFNMVTTQLICMTTSGLLVHMFGWNLPFWLGVIASIFGIFFAWKIKVVDIKPVAKSHHSFRKYLQRTNTISGLKMVTFLSMMAHAVLFITVFGFSPIMAVSIGVEEQQFVWLMGAFFVPHALTSLGLMIYQLNPRHNKLVLITSFIITAMFLFLIPTADSLLAICLYHAGLGLSLGFIFPLLLSEVVSITPEDLKMSAMGYYQSFYSIGILLGPIVAGSVAENAGLTNLFIYAAVMTLLTAGLLIIYSRKKVIK